MTKTETTDAAVVERLRELLTSTRKSGYSVGRIRVQVECDRRSGEDFEVGFESMLLGKEMRGTTD